MASYLFQIFAFLLFSSSTYSSYADDTYFLPPLNTKSNSSKEVALLLIQGASCNPKLYKPLAEAIQSTSEYRLWVGVPEYIADTPEPAQFGSKINDVLGRMKSAGMNAEKTFIAAHSLGGVMSQIYVSSGKTGIDGLILMGATLLRKYRNSSFPAPTLTIDGDLDGLLHVTRQAEAFFHQVLSKSSFEDAAKEYPVVMLEGLSHWSFASGTPPSNVKSNDLKPEISEEDAHDEVAKVISNYLIFTAGDDQDGKSVAALVNLLQSTQTYMQPLLDALHMEGYHYLETPCNSDYPTNPTCQYPKWPDKSLVPPAGPPNPLPPTNCQCGSKWVAGNAQRMMCGLDSSVVVNTKDAFHDVSDVRPFHLPHIFKPTPGTSCSSPDSSCEIDTTTVSMPIYDAKDELDTGLYPVTASEYRTKLKSRQACMEAAGIKNVNYTEMDRNNASICKSINVAAWNWAMSNASPKALERFAKLGQPYRFVDDKWSGIGPTGPKWIHDALSYTVSEDKKYVDVQSHYFTTENEKLGNETYLHTIGYHYCKLLSPARAMEWIYSDGLKQFGGINN